MFKRICEIKQLLFLQSNASRLNNAIHLMWPSPPPTLCNQRWFVYQQIMLENLFILMIFSSIYLFILKPNPDKSRNFSKHFNQFLSIRLISFFSKRSEFQKNKYQFLLIHRINSFLYLYVCVKFHKNTYSFDENLKKNSFAISSCSRKKILFF